MKKMVMTVQILVEVPNEVIAHPHQAAYEWLQENIFQNSLDWELEYAEEVDEDKLANPDIEGI